MNFFSLFFIFQQPHRSFPNLFLHELESLRRQIIPHMPLKPKIQQLSELFPIFVSHKAFGSSEKVVVYARNEGVDVLLKCFRAFVILRSGLIEQGISVVKERYIMENSGAASVRPFSPFDGDEQGGTCCFPFEKAHIRAAFREKRSFFQLHMMRRYLTFSRPLSGFSSHFCNTYFRDTLSSSPPLFSNYSTAFRICESSK